MADHVPGFFAKYGTVAYRILMVIGFAAVFWLKGTFASKEDAEQLKQSIESGRTEIYRLAARFEVMIEANKVNDRQDVAIRDHEERLRRLESGRGLQRTTP